MQRIPRHPTLIRHDPTLIPRDPTVILIPRDPLGV
jgi:hypothetical protein